MPIYDYYCDACHGQFSHLARGFDEDAPPCPRCGNTEVERMVTVASVLHSDRYYEAQLRAAADQIDDADDAEVAQFLKDSGRLEDATGLYGSKAYIELLERRAEGATDEDVADLVDDLTASLNVSEATKATGALLFSKDVDARMKAESPPEPDEENSISDDVSGNVSESSRRSADKLGWG